MFKEAATLFFFIMTGYKFRPASNNPYFVVPTDDYEMEEEVLVSGTAIDEQVVKRKAGKVPAAPDGLDDPVGDDDSDDSAGMVFFPNEKPAELSHDLD